MLGGMPSMVQNHMTQEFKTMMMMLMPVNTL